MNIKKKDLEIKLQKIPAHPNPNPDLEQYVTPSDLASDILFTAFMKGHIKNKKVIDLGCGTGIFSLGSAFLGANEVIGYDLDGESIKLARKIAEKWELDNIVSFKQKDIESVDEECDTVIMNPPFGSQKKGADLPFLIKSFEISDHVYTIHNLETIDFLRDYIKDREHEIFLERGYDLTIKRTFDFHTRDKKNVGVVIFGIKV